MDMNYFNIFTNYSQICMGFKADRVEKGQYLAYLIRFSEKCLIKKLLTKQMLKILVDLQYNF